MIVIDFLFNFAEGYYHHTNATDIFATFGISYFIFFLGASFWAGTNDDKLSVGDKVATFTLGLLGSLVFALVAGILPLIISTVGVLFLTFIIMSKWGKNYNKLQSYKKDDTSAYVKEIARLEELVKQFEKSK